MPGRVALAIAPRFLERAVGELPLGLIFVSGSNGKSTTTNMLAAILREHGMRVFTNPSGGNLPQGIASALLADVPLDGRVRADVGVLEVDEAYGVGLSDLLRPRHVLLLNVQIDQLNRFFEPTRVAGMLAHIADRASESLIVNADDESLRRIAGEFVGQHGSGASGSGASPSPAVSTFGASPEVIAGSPHGLANVSDAGGRASTLPTPSALITRLGERDATVVIGDIATEIALPARGVHYAVDAAGALASSLAVLGSTRFDSATAARALAGLRTVYGRGELLHVGGEDIEIIMMKNPPSLQLNLDYLQSAPEQVFVSVDEGTPDPSWLWDIDLSSLTHADIVSGTKAWQFATRFGYEGLPVGRVEPELKPALEAFLALPKPSTGLKTMIVNYEQMMLIRKQLGFLDLEGGES